VTELLLVGSELLSYIVSVLGGMCV